ncbi:MAG: energy-coupled thiamine transporter ThiT [Ruminococcaceae bacterium]|nr:energy-coupled thiamine transporter ThiT [Oscillospiraceae bacterium]
MKTKSKTNIIALTEGAMTVALSFVLELFFVWLNNITGIGALLPFGGTITVSMLPIAYYSYRRGATFGIGAGLVYSALQMMLGWYLPPAGTWWAVLLCVLLDYLLAFTVIGSADLFAKLFGKKRLLGYCAASVTVSLIRFVSSFFSGVVLWGSYAPEGMNVWLYSLIYNGSYMFPNAILMGIFTVILCRALDPKTLKPMK